MRSPPVRFWITAFLLLCAPAAARAQQGAAAQSWFPVGPSPISTQQSAAISGRVTSISVDPADPSGNTVVLGTAGGGVWRSTNAASANPAFAPLTDTLSVFNDGEATASLAIGAVTVQPGGTQVILAGTGEAATFGDAHYGTGLLRSSDNGLSWDLVAGSQDGAGGNHSFTGEAFAGFAWGTAGNVVAALSQAGGAAQVGAVTLGASVRGLYYSSDAGQTWQLATIEDIGTDGSTQIVQGPQTNYSDYDGNSALAVLWNPLRKKFFAVVQGHGLYSSPDGSTWTRLATQPGTGLALTACPTDPGYPAAAACPLQQAALALNPVTGDMFFWAVDASGNDYGIWQDACAPQNNSCASTVTFSAQIVTTSLQNGAGQISNGTNGLVLSASPSTSGTTTTLLAGAQTLATCDVATGCAWQTSCASNTFPGIRALDTTSSATMYLGTQGGLWRASNVASACSANSFSDLNSNLGPLAPLESIAGSATQPSLLLAGAGALGSAATSSAPAWSANGNAPIAWPQITPEEGGNVALDTVNGIAYATLGPGVQIGRCTAGSNCGPGDFSLAIGPQQVQQDQSLLHAPYLLDPALPAQILVGTCRVWRGPADGTGWTPANILSPMLDGNPRQSCNGNTLLRSVAAGGPVQANGSQIIYAGMQGLARAQPGPALANAGHVFVTTNAQNANGNAQWIDISLSPVTNPGLNNATFNAAQFDISSLAADSHDPTGATVYATIYGLHVAHIYRSTDFGAHWLNVSANLPDVPASFVVIDPNDANTVYIALDTGVYFTRSITQCAQQDCWQQYGTALPNTVITALAADGGSVGLLRAATRGRGAWQIPLATGPLAGETAVSVAPSTLSFPAQQVSTVSAPQSVSVTVTGVNPLTVTQVEVTGDFSESSNCTAQPVATANSCTVHVLFAPSATGTRTGTLTLYGNLPGGQAGPFQLNGTGLGAPQIVLSPSGTANFGDVTVGQMSAPTLVELANTGQSSATLNSFQATSPFAIISNNCGATLPANTGCTVGIAFLPTARGSQEGAFSVTDSAGTQSLALAGTGEAPANLAFNPTQLQFPATSIGSKSATESLVVTNTGDVSATLTGISASGDFQVTDNGCAQSLAGGGSCSIGVAFLPTQAGARTGTLTVLIASQTSTAQLSGTGIGTPALTLAPTALAFGYQNLQQPSAPQSITVTNTGSAPDTITAISTQTTTAGTQDYAATSNCTTLQPRQSCTIQVTFAPSVPGEDDGTLTLAASVPGTSITAQLTGAGNTVAWAKGQAPAAAVPSGQTATYALSLQVVGYSGALATTCQGLPAAATCAWGQPLVVEPGSGMGSVTFTVATGPDTVAANVEAAARQRMVLAFCLPGLAMPLALRRRRWLAACLLFAICGCGGSANPASQSANLRLAPGTYNFSVTASGGGMASTLPVTLIVQ